MLPARKFYGQNFMPDFFNDFFGNMSLDGTPAKAPAVNVMEDDQRYRLELAAPGLTKDDFKVHINKDGNLVIEVEKKFECQEDKKGKYIRKEFSCSKFHQTLILPENVNRDEITAAAENGILFVELPKVQKTKAEEEKRMIEVK
jgi:HSP20 family protein